MRDTSGQLMNARELACLRYFNRHFEERVEILPHTGGHGIARVTRADMAVLMRIYRRKRHAQPDQK